MPKPFAILLILIGCGFGGWTVYLQTRTVPKSLVLEHVSDDEIMFLCTETGEVSRGPWAATPAVNPKTGRLTLVQGLYCPQCKKWYPAPPPEMARQSPRGPTCPVDKSPLFTEEPLD